jgi:pyruvate kinase
MDLQGPKLRIGKVDGEIHLTEGQLITVTTEECMCTSELLFVSYARLAMDAKPGERILLNDGKVELKVTEIIDEKRLRAAVVVGGVLTSNKGFNLPETQLTVPCLTEKDLKDLEFGLKQNVDWVALSFVRKPEDILELKR